MVATAADVATIIQVFVLTPFRNTAELLTNAFELVIIDFKQKVAIYPEIGVSPDGMFPVSHFLPFDFKCKFVHRGACKCVRASMRAWLGLKAGNEREGGVNTMFKIFKIL